MKIAATFLFRRPDGLLDLFRASDMVEEACDFLTSIRSINSHDLHEGRVVNNDYAETPSHNDDCGVARAISVTCSFYDDIESGDTEGKSIDSNFETVESPCEGDYKTSSEDGPKVKGRCPAANPPVQGLEGTTQRGEKFTAATERDGRIFLSVFWIHRMSVVALGPPDTMSEEDPAAANEWADAAARVKVSAATVIQSLPSFLAATAVEWFGGFRSIWDMDLREEAESCIFEFFEPLGVEDTDEKDGNGLELGDELGAHLCCSSLLCSIEEHARCFETWLFTAAAASIASTSAAADDSVTTEGFESPSGAAGSKVLSGDTADHADTPPTAVRVPDDENNLVMKTDDSAVSIANEELCTATDKGSQYSGSGNGSDFSSSTSSYSTISLARQYATPLASSVSGMDRCDNEETLLALQENNEISGFGVGEFEGGAGRHSSEALTQVEEAWQAAWSFAAGVMSRDALIYKLSLDASYKVRSFRCRILSLNEHQTLMYSIL